MVGHIERQNSDLKRHSDPSVVSRVLRYPRHFLLLACFSVLVVVMSRLHPTVDPSISFALYGALHALALVLALRGHPTIWGKCLLIAFAAALCVLSFRFGAAARELFGAVPGNVAFYALLGLSSIIGAASYAILIRLSGLYALTITEIAAIAACCMLAAFVSLFTASHFHALGAWWFAVLWWFTFSGGLWYFDRPRRSKT
jgi:hypothetical protein